MGIFRSDDPARDFYRHDKERQEWEDTLPRCDECGEIMDDFAYEINGDLLCIQCVIEKYRRDAEDYAK